MGKLTNFDRDIDFLYQLGSLRHVQRSWRQYFGTDVATDLEHTMRVAFIALILAEREGGADDGMILKMALIHDLAESLTGDLTPIQKRYVTIDEKKAVEDMFKGTSLSGYSKILDRYLERKCLESQIVKDADRIDIDVEIQELIIRGHNMTTWEKRRKDVEKLFYTKSAQELWKAVQGSDPSNWREVIENVG